MLREIELSVEYTPGEYSTINSTQWYTSLDEFAAEHGLNAGEYALTSETTLDAPTRRHSLAFQARVVTTFNTNEVTRVKKTLIEPEPPADGDPEDNPWELPTAPYNEYCVEVDGQCLRVDEIQLSESAQLILENLNEVACDQAAVSENPQLSPTSSTWDSF